MRRLTGGDLAPLEGVWQAPAGVNFLTVDWQIADRRCVRRSRHFQVHSPVKREDTLTVGREGRWHFACPYPERLKPGAR